MATQRSWTDKRMELFIGKLLRTGVMLAAVVAACGAVAYLARHGDATADYHTFRSEPANLRSVRGIIRDACALHGMAIIQLGLLLLIATPVARVAFSIFGFAQEHDRMYVVVTIIVLLVLIYSIVGPAWL